MADQISGRGYAVNVDSGVRPASPQWDVFALAVVETLQGRLGFHLAPQIPETVVYRALKTFLTIGPDELLLAIYDTSNGAATQKGCALTTQRLCWFDRDGTPTQGPQSRRYAELPEILPIQGRVFPTIALGQEVELSLPKASRAELAGLAGVLSVLGRGARQGGLENLVSEEAIDRARQSLFRIPIYPEASQRAVRESQSFLETAKQGSPRLWVTPFLIIACVLVGVIMVATGVSPTQPTTQDLFRWGGNSGVAEAVDGEYWRLVTSIFLHGGIIHLAFNMWCLASSGQLVERIYGRFGFAFLYLLAGIGGSLASAWWHPLVIGVGASGAIFGVIGGLLAFLVVHRATIPIEVLKPLLSSTLIFVAYNILPGFLSTRIDNAAHLGGLVTGFVGGLLLSRPWPVKSTYEGFFRQLGLAAVLTLATGGIGFGVLKQVSKNPDVIAMEDSLTVPLRDYKALMEDINSQIDTFNDLSDRLQRFLSQIDGRPANDPKTRRELDALISEASKSRENLASVKETNPETQAIRESFTAAFNWLRESLTTIRRALDEPKNQALISGPEGIKVLMQRQKDAIKAFETLSETYLKTHNLEVVPKP